MADRNQPSRLIDTPEPCWCRIKTDRHGAWYGARIYSVLGMLRGEINGEDVHPLTVWHFGNRITESEYHTLMRVANETKPF